jgi:hypothetical protein
MGARKAAQSSRQWTRLSELQIILEGPNPAKYRLARNLHPQGCVGKIGGGMEEVEIWVLVELVEMGMAMEEWEWDCHLEEEIDLCLRGRVGR